jgi:hypothetical protein
MESWFGNQRDSKIPSWGLSKTIATSRITRNSDVYGKIGILRMTPFTPLHGTECTWDSDGTVQFDVMAHVFSKVFRQLRSVGNTFWFMILVIEADAIVAERLRQLVVGKDFIGAAEYY